MNGDGFVDALVGAPGVIGRGGRVYLYLGSTMGLSATPVATLTSPDGDPSFGSLVSVAGDVNGDGYGDVLVAAPDHNSNDGRVYAYYGSASGLDAMHPTILDSVSPGVHFGRAVAGGGDGNADGFADIVISDGDHLYIYHGTPIGLYPSADVVVTSPDGLAPPYGTLAMGDLNGDGYSDIIATTPQPHFFGGRVGFVVVAGGGSVRYPAFPSEFPDNDPPPRHARCLAARFIGDMNGDGYGDIAVTGAGTMGGTGPMLRRVGVEWHR